jgi:N-acyl-D-amino-acid deacylase
MMAVLKRMKDIALLGDTIYAIGSFQTDAETVIDATARGCPGFIDTVGHFTLLADPRAEGKVSQGVTTEINGNCGMSAAPLYDRAFDRRQDDLNDLGIRKRWHSLDEYFTLVMERGIALNLATLAGHGNIRGSIVGYDDKLPSEDELSRMSALLETTIEEGAIGLSTGLIYPPGVYSKLKIVSTKIFNRGLLYTSHMRRSETSGVGRGSHQNA